jgi:RNA polymerase sigma factor (sigma-70 family)
MLTAANLTKIWVRIIQGDDRAWQELVRRYAAMVYTVARRVGLSELDAEDCAQHSWLTLYRKRRTIKDPVAIPAWLVRTTHREAIRMAQNLRRPAVLDIEAAPGDARSVPHDEVRLLEFQVTLNRALDQLDPRCRKLITEMYLSGSDKKYREIASLIGVKPNSFGPLRKRCLVKLKEIFKKMDYPLD